MCDPYRVGGQRRTTGTGRAGTAPSTGARSAMPGARRGSPWRARGSHMCDPYRVGGQSKTTGTGIHVRVPEQRWAKVNHRNRHTCACAGTVAGKGEPPEPAFTCVWRNSGGQRKTTGTGIHVRVPEQWWAKVNHRNRHTCACAGTAPCLAHVGARHGEHPPGTWPAGRTCATPTVLAGKGKPPEPAYMCVRRNSAMPGTRRGSPRRAPSGHMARGSHMCDPYGVNHRHRHSRACAGIAAGRRGFGQFTCVCRNNGGQRRTTGTGIHVRVPGQRRAKENPRNRCGCGGYRCGYSAEPFTG